MRSLKLGFTILVPPSAGGIPGYFGALLRRQARGAGLAGHRCAFAGVRVWIQLGRLKRFVELFGCDPHNVDCTLGGPGGSSIVSAVLVACHPPSGTRCQSAGKRSRSKIIKLTHYPVRDPELVRACGVEVALHEVHRASAARIRLRRLESTSTDRALEVPWCITLDNSKGISRLRFWAKKSRVNGINDLPVFMHQGISVTQSFNTATSMGRLTLHMLLSFAQFEREVTARADPR